MSDFETNMHQIRFRLGLRPRPRCRGRLQRSPRPLSGILGEREGKGRGGEGKGRKKEGVRAEGEGREGREEWLQPPQSKLSGYVADEGGCALRRCPATLFLLNITVQLI